MKQVIFTSFFLLLFFLSSGKGNNNEADSKQKEEVLKFARRLELNKDYYRAITEYKRQLFQTKNSATQRRCYLGIARCYYEGKKWVALNKACIDAGQVKGYSKEESHALIKARALALWNMGQNQLAFQLINDLSSDDPSSQQLRAWTALATGKQKQAAEYFAVTGDEQRAAQVRSYEKEEYSPALAGALSAIIPGAGQLYTGNKEAALGAFLVNALLIGATVESFEEGHEWLGTGLGLLSLGFYSGNIYGAINFAHQNNALKSDDWLAKNSNLAGRYKESIILDIKIPF